MALVRLKVRAAVYIAPLLLWLHATVFAGTLELAIPAPSGGSQRPITLSDMGRLRFIARAPNEHADRQRLSVSPDGQHVAFQVYQGDPDANKYRVAWYVASTRRGFGTPISVGDGGDIDLQVTEAGLGTGTRVAASMAKWSPEGRWIAYLARRAGDVQLWRSRADGGKQEQLTHSEGRVRGFSWTDDGRALYFNVERIGPPAARAARESEGRRGYLINDRFNFMESKYPLEKAASDSESWTYDIQKATTRPQTPSEAMEFERSAEEPRELFVKSMGRASDSNASQSDGVNELLGHRSDIALPVLSQGKNRRLAFARVVKPLDRAYLPTAVVAVISSKGRGAVIACGIPLCKGIIRNLWWASDGHEVYFERGTENWVSDGFYAWSPSENVARKIFSTDDSLDGCAIAEGRGADRLICESESITQPGTVASIDLKSGTSTLIVHPNPEFRGILLTKVERLEWSSGIGDGLIDRAFGYLVKPIGYAPGQRYPLVVLTKEATGFLQEFGGGGEYPAHVFADRGMMVLICHEPFASLDKFGDEGRFQNDFQVRRHTLESLEVGIKLLEDRGLIDPNKVALTGFSDGADLGYFALFRSHRRFATAIFSTPNWESFGYYMMPTSIRHGIASQSGLKLERDGPSAWFYDGLAPSRNVDLISSPILFHLADNEVLSALQSLVTMEERGKPFEGYVFPDEYHMKCHPPHLLAFSPRNIQ